MNRISTRKGNQLKLLLLFTVIAMVGFGIPRLLWATHLGYSLIALLLTQVMTRGEPEPIWSQRLYRGLGLVSVATLWLWLLTPLELINSGVPGPQLESSGGMERDPAGEALCRGTTGERCPSDGCHRRLSAHRSDRRPGDERSGDDPTRQLRTTGSGCC